MIWFGLQAKMTVKPLSQCKKCHFIKAQINDNIEKAVQQRKKSNNKSFNLFDEENNAIDNFLYALKAPETKRQ
ncbi:MAG: hypothetical protein QOK72_10425 [Nitrososphaeraceae archaeon]|nr:hypothetical protein [Nitrososphaeraceae archaeon]